MSSNNVDLRKYALLSIGTALATIGFKGTAWWMTGSVGLLSDAIESFVNLAGALMAFWMLSLAMQPADAKHPYGHGKAEYFSSGFEGLLILVAAFGIGHTAWARLVNPQPLEAVGIGLAISVVASILNLAVARVLLQAGKAHSSITLEADGHHLMTDVWTSAGVIVGVGLAWLTGLTWADPVIAILVAVNILWTGWKLIRRSTSGLMDAAIPPEELLEIEAVLASFHGPEVAVHALRTRQAGARVFISFHLLVPGAWPVKAAHDLSEEVEAALKAKLPTAHITTHLEPLEDPRSLEDADLDRL